jgi:hypothetical protein
MSYESQIKRVLKLIEGENQNSADVLKLPSTTFVPRPDMFRKLVGVISLCKAFNPETGTANPGGFINPLVTVMAGIPTLSSPPVVIPVLLDYQPAGEPIVLPDVDLNTTATILLVASTDNETVAPDSADDVTNMSITITPSDTGIAQTLTGTPTFVGPGVMSIPLSADETNVGGTDPTITINFNNFATGVIGTSMSIPLSTPTTVTPSLNPPAVSVNQGALSSSPIGNGNIAPIVTQFPINLTNNNVPMGVPIITPTF